MEFTNVLDAFSSLFTSAPLSKKSPIPVVVMILSPHPDDESIVGALPLRLLHENNVHVVNVAVTLGSNEDRQEERLRELSEACELLDVENVVLDESWAKKAKELKSLLQKYQPALVLAPHSKDHHPTHIRTGELLKKVLPQSKQGPVLVAWTEFWGQMASPNLLVEVPREILELQMRALEKHAGEVARNPYHLRLPAWMMDNVRRGAELIRGKGEAAPGFAFGVLYKLQLFKAGKFSTPKLRSPILPAEEDLGQIFRLIFDAASGSRTRVK